MECEIHRSYRMMQLNVMEKMLVLFPCALNEAAKYSERRGVVKEYPSWHQVGAI
jgi:hypothetical protein